MDGMHQDPSGPVYPDYGYRQDYPPKRPSVVPAVIAGLLTAFIVSSIVGFLAGLGGAYLMGRSGTTSTPNSVRVVGGSTQEPVTAAAAAAVPSVVNIDISGETQQGGQNGLPKSHPSVPLQGNGSGVAYKAGPNGGTYIITNNHVVENAKSIVVTDANGNRNNGSLVGRDPETDIAVVLVKERIPTIQLTDSDQVRVGALTVAIGSPFGLQHTVTSGIVSATHRALTDSGDGQTGTYPLVDVIQTDAAINPGNSGGALVDRQGRLIGINTAIYSTTTGSSGGIGFAVPEKTAVRIANELISGGKTQHPFLGVVGQTVDENVAQQRKLPVTEGALVISVTKGTGAAKAGIRSGDVIVGLDSTPIRSMDDLILATRQKSVGDVVTLHLYRGGKKIDVKMTVGTKPKSLAVPSNPSTTTTP